jgi:cell division protein FtsB
MKVFSIILVLLLVLLQYRLWIGEGSVAEVARLSDQVELQHSENAALTERNAALQAEVADLKQGLEAIEERARSELGMIREGETFYHVVGPARDQGAP